MSPEIAYDETATEFILEAFGKDTDRYGYVVDSETGERVTNTEGDEIKASELAGIEKGSEIFIDDNFVSLLEHIQRRTD